MNIVAGERAARMKKSPLVAPRWQVERWDETDAPYLRTFHWTKASAERAVILWVRNRRVKGYVE